MTQIDFNALANSPQYQLSISTQRTALEVEHSLVETSA